MPGGPSSRRSACPAPCTTDGSPDGPPGPRAGTRGATLTDGAGCLRSPVRRFEYCWGRHTDHPRFLLRRWLGPAGHGLPAGARDGVNRLGGEGDLHSSACWPGRLAGRVITSPLCAFTTTSRRPSIAGYTTARARGPGRGGGGRGGNRDPRGWAWGGRAI